ncbi:Transcriptional regulator, XRE family [Modestobacter italicus]|uniref:Transcriptional regulator, XRE family n=1 Tax=Modestobacter italicus (strain DSM 44449 / CECT 9708 / BC 501) TaxID=2732864 RepID=I4ES80_MODI5|nr:XRE family transcriptional regulator [Modestobacter marinus]CCH86243.1 Transcriptional regulator, XRE family [Modestobacter marinus]
MPDVPSPEPDPVDDELGVALGGRIRERRRAQGLTMVQLAERAELSQPFLSQVERGLARPSMGSLHRIARSLGTTTPALMAGAGPSGDARFSVVRAGAGTTVQHDGGSTRALAQGSPALLPLEFRVTHRDFPDFFQHPAAEFLYVVAGRIEVDLGDQGRHQLSAADSLYYAGEVPHRFRLTGRTPATVLVVQGGAEDHPG